LCGLDLTQLAGFRFSIILSFAMHAETVRLSLHHVGIKIVSGGRMHVLQWRRHLLQWCRHLLWDEVLLDGSLQAASHGLWGRENVYGLVFGRDLDGSGGDQVMLLIDPWVSYSSWSGSEQRLKGVRLEGKKGPLVSYGTLDPKSLEKPATFSDWMNKTMGIEWGMGPGRPNQLSFPERAGLRSCG
jgi:hypothetical protein